MIEGFRALEPGSGEAVAARTVLRRKENGERETWGDVAHRVALGNISLVGQPEADSPALLDWAKEYSSLGGHIASGRLLMSGRHLQHGDENQPERPQEVFTNCSTAAASFLVFYLLLNGSGVGRAYSDALMLVDWERMPKVIPVIDREHKDYPAALYHVAGGEVPFLTSEEARAYLDVNPDAVTGVTWFDVPDSREGWAKAVELLEVMTFEGNHEDEVLILDFSGVRPQGSPIAGMQGRPSSGPVPLMQALMNVYSVKGQGWEPWKQTMYVDHHLAECVLVGGARRAARMSVKDYRDPGAEEFINIKQTGGLWTSNNSLGVDDRFWRGARLWHDRDRFEIDPEGIVPWTEAERSSRIFEAVCTANYLHKTGEPGFVALDKINRQGEDEELLRIYGDGNFAGNDRFQLSGSTLSLTRALVRAVLAMDYRYIVNPCGEIRLFVLGGYCVIADSVPFHADTLEEATDAFCTAARALVRVNLMDSLYQKETERTMRIGVGPTGLFEAAWKHFGCTFRDLIEDADELLALAAYMDAAAPKASIYDTAGVRNRAAFDFWTWVYRTREAVEMGATEYAELLGVNAPHTFTTIKPAGTTSKLFGLSEGAHLPAYREYIRWVQFKNTDPIIEEYRAKGYPVQDRIFSADGQEKYKGHSIVGFPTRLVIRRLGIPEERFTTAPEATMEEQFAWVKLLEAFWLGPRGNQVSYTLKYDRTQVSFDEYKATLLLHQPEVRCISVMPESDWRESKDLFGYLPEEPISVEEYEQTLAFLQAMAEESDLRELECAGGACPIL
jgi:adenosylcobalamin-dependent ribonucleoside-triphosphate reductase